MGVFIPVTGVYNRLLGRSSLLLPGNEMQPLAGDT